MKKFIIICVLIVLAIIVATVYYFKYVSYPRDKEGMMNKYKINCDEFAFTAERSDYMYEPGDNVALIFSMIATDTDYSFNVEGVDEFSVDYYDDNGFLIQFIMPHSEVNVSYTAKNTMEREVSEEIDEITISLKENPTTIFHWVYEIEPEGIVELADERYVSDENDADEPVCGLGGTHFWKFNIVDDGVVEIKFYETQGDEIDEEYDCALIYRYECADGKARSLE